MATGRLVALGFGLNHVRLGLELAILSTLSGRLHRIVLLLSDLDTRYERGVFTTQLLGFSQLRLLRSLDRGGTLCCSLSLGICHTR